MRLQEQAENPNRATFSKVLWPKQLEETGGTNSFCSLWVYGFLCLVKHSPIQQMLTNIKV